VNQITKMFMESNARMKKIMAGGYKQEEICSAQREFEGQIKLLNAVISAYGIQSKNGRAMKGLNRMNIMDETTAVDLMLGDPENDKVKCDEQGKMITRAECLDYSGSHFDGCQGCDVGKATKEKLLPQEGM
jgi:hypothetical protein